MSSEVQAFLQARRRFDLIIHAGERTDTFGHAFFTGNLLASSDVVQEICFGKLSGDPNRPLRQVGPVTWVLEGHLEKFEVP